MLPVQERALGGRQADDAGMRWVTRALSCSAAVYRRLPSEAARKTQDP
jgi:hypothetical protein